MVSCVDCGLASPTVGTSSGVISVSRIDCSTASTDASNCSVLITQRIRCCISVFGTPPFTP